MKAQAVPYAGATSGESARGEITKILRRFGCSSIVQDWSHDGTDKIANAQTVEDEENQPPTDDRKTRASV